jgi:hypothetical protein
MHTRAWTTLLVLLFTVLFPSRLCAQRSFLKDYSLNGNLSEFQSLPPSNSVSHIAVRSTTVWIGTGKGLARTPNGGRSWESFRAVPQFASDDIFSIALRGDTVWAATGYTKEVEGKGVQTGTGYTFSFDNGGTWSSLPQPLDSQDDSLVAYGSNTVKFLPIVVPEQNVTFDLALSASAVWIASWSSGLRKSTNSGQTWQRIVLPSSDRNSIAPSDVLGRYVIDPRFDNNYLMFSVCVENDSTIWAGSAGGINRSTDGGLSWTKFNTENQVSHILGNWVIAIKGQKSGTKTRIWTTNWKADKPEEEFGVSYTDDGGRIWHNHLLGIKAYDFAFKDPIAYVATDDGIYRTDDAGDSWTRSGSVIDNTAGQRLATQQFFSVGVAGDTVFCGSGDGLAKTIDNAEHPFAQSWEVLRTYRPVGTTSTTYAYPNPFQPDKEFTRIHYGSGGGPTSVTIEIFDFGMNRVRTVVKDAQRFGSGEHDELWDGKDDGMRQVANGVYFYRVVVENGEPSWGKIMVLQ